MNEFIYFGIFYVLGILFFSIFLRVKTKNNNKKSKIVYREMAKKIKADAEDHRKLHDDKI
tara:strand:- start:22 stop:201 length:180 start_codon:yes stop_codon:yes gene_type:complete